MNCFIKSRDTFLTYEQAVVSEYSVPLVSAEGAQGTMTVVGELTQDYTGEWVVLGEHLLYIVSVTPQNNMTELVVGDVFTAFSRPVAYVEPTSYYLGEYIREFAESEYINQPDTYFDMPYLTVTNSDTTEFAHVPPNDGIISLETVIRDAMLKGVQFAVSFDEDSLTIAVSTGPTAPQTVVLGDGRSELVEETYNRELIAKVTVISELGYPHVYYKTLTGEITTEPPVNRPRGEWVTVQQGADNLLDTAKEAFAASIDSHKIVFYSTLALSMSAPLLVRLKDKVYETQITYIGIQTYDNRFLYECGEAISTLTGRVAELGRAVSAAVASIPTAVSQVRNDVPFAALNLATRIPANADLNDYTEPGNYYVQDSADAQTIAHGPTTSTGYRLWVVRMTASYYVQVALPNSTTPRLYTRRFQSGVFSAWARFMLSGEALPVQPASETITFSAVSAVGFGHASSATAVRLFVPIPNNATSASVSTTGTWTLGTTGGSVSVSGLSVAQVARNGVWLSGTASGLTSGTPVELKCATGSSITFEWS